MRQQTSPEYVANFWNVRFPGQIPERLVIVEELMGNVIDLEGRELVVVEVGHTDTDVRVNSVSPGSTDTPGANNVLACIGATEEHVKVISKTVPLGRFGTSNEIAKAVVFLASDDSSYITGTELLVDGGFAQA